MTNAINEQGGPASPAMLPPDFYQAMALCLAGLDRLGAMRTRSAKANDDLFADVSDDEIDRNLARAMAQLLDEMPIDDIEQVLRRRRNMDAADAGSPRWGRGDSDLPVLELSDGDAPKENG